jgi:hypothetical protein
MGGGLQHEWGRRKSTSTHPQNSLYQISLLGHRTRKLNATFPLFCQHCPDLDVAMLLSKSHCVTRCPQCAVANFGETWRELACSYNSLHYEAQNLLGCTAVFLIGCRPTFQMCVLPPSSGRSSPRRYIPEDSKRHLPPCLSQPPNPCSPTSARLARTSWTGCAPDYWRR